MASLLAPSAIQARQPDHRLLPAIRRVGSRVASFLVLEDEKDYTRLNLEDERGKTVTGDFATFLDQAWKKLGKVLPPQVRR